MGNPESLEDRISKMENDIKKLQDEMSIPKSPIDAFEKFVKLLLENIGNKLNIKAKP